MPMLTRAFESFFTIIKKKNVIIMQLNSSACILRTHISLLSQLLCSQMTKISLEVQAIAIPRLSLTVQSALSLTGLMKTSP